MPCKNHTPPARMNKTLTMLKIILIVNFPLIVQLNKQLLQKLQLLFIMYMIFFFKSLSTNNRAELLSKLHR